MSEENRSTQEILAAIEKQLMGINDQLANLGQISTTLMGIASKPGK